MERLKIDPRVRLLLVPIVGIATVAVTDRVAFMLLALGIGGVMYLSGVYKSTTKFLFLIGSTFVLQCLLQKLNLTSLSVLLVTVLYVLQRIMLFAMLGASITSTLTVGELIYTLEKFRIPRRAVIPIAVTLRFLPTVKQEFGCIKESMRIRGIDTSVSGFVRHPVQWAEYMLVPMLMRSFKIADELSAAAMVRGIERKGKKTLLYEFKMNPVSLILLAGFIGYSVGVCIL